MNQIFKKLLFYSSLIYHANCNSIYQIIEHQKSGGTWVAKIISGYMDIPFITRPDRWLRGNSLVRIHSPRQYTINSKKQIYILRDGRDVLTSYYFHLFVRLKISQAKQFDDINDVRKNMPKFLEMYFKNQLGNKTTWVEHTRNWIHPGTQIIRYEDMLEDTMGTLLPVLKIFERQPIDIEQLSSVIEDNDFKRVSGRKKGEEDQNSFHRKGITGDYKNYFNKDAARIFHFYAGKQLINLGYEKDDSWIQTIGNG